MYPHATSFTVPGILRGIWLEQSTCTNCNNYITLPPLSKYVAAHRSSDPLTRRTPHSQYSTYLQVVVLPEALVAVPRA